MKRPITMISIIILTILASNIDLYCFIEVAEDNWHFKTRDPNSGDAYSFVPFGTNYWDPETFVWVGIYDPFENYNGGVNTCGGNYDGNLDFHDWVTIAKREQNDDLLYFPPPGDFTLDTKWQYPLQLSDIFDHYFPDGYSDGVNLATGYLIQNTLKDQLVVSTMSKDDIVLIFEYEPLQWKFDELNIIEIPGIEGYNDGVNITCGDFDCDGLDEVAVSPLYYNTVYNSIRIFKIDIQHHPILWKTIPISEAGNLKDISICAGNISQKENDLPRDDLVITGINQGSIGINEIPMLFLCTYEPVNNSFNVEHIGNEFFNSDYTGALNIACGRIDRESDHDQLITSAADGQDHIRVYNYDPSNKALVYLTDNNGVDKGHIDNIFSDAYKKGLTVSTARLYSFVPGTNTYRDHILIGSMDFKDVVMFRDYHPEWSNNDGWHNYGRANVITDYDTYRTDKYLRELKKVNINIIKLILSPGVFIDENDYINMANVEKLKNLIHIADKYDFKVILSMSNWWEGWPVTWDLSQMYSDPATLEEQKKYFGTMAELLKDEEAIFAYNPMNEPVVEWGDRSDSAKNDPINVKWNQWVHDKYEIEDEWRNAWGRFADEFDDWNNYIYPAINNFQLYNRKLFDYQLFREHIAEEWVKEITATIKAADPNHLVQSPGLLIFSTVLFPNSWGYLPSNYSAFNPFRLAKHVDYIDLHLYPWQYGNSFFTNEELAHLLACLRYCYFGKPIISSDFGSDLFVKTAPDFFRITEKSLSGWLNWHAFESDDTGWLNRYVTLFDAAREVTPLGEFYRTYRGNFPNRSSATSIITIDMLEALTSLEKAHEYTEEARNMILQNHNTPDFLLDYPCLLRNGSVNPIEGSTNTIFTFKIKCIKDDTVMPEKISINVTMDPNTDHSYDMIFDINLTQKQIISSEKIDPNFEFSTTINHVAESFDFFFSTPLKNGQNGFRSRSVTYHGKKITESLQISTPTLAPITSPTPSPTYSPELFKLKKPIILDHDVSKN
jgi:hypothetical protein